MSEEPRKPHGIMWSMGVIAVLLLYLLSWGPVMAWDTSVRLYASEPPAHPIWQWVEDFYRPVQMLRESRAIRDLSDPYARWWLGIFLP